jgi:hypothetical protein
VPLQALHLAYEAGPSATYDVPAWASGRRSRLVVSSAAVLVITVTDGEGEVIECEAGCATGRGPVVHDGGRSSSDLSARVCAKIHFDSSPCRAQVPTFLFEVSLVQGPRGHLGLSGAETRSQTSKGLAVSALRARTSSFKRNPKPQGAASTSTRVNPFPAPEISTFVITSLSSQNLCKAHFPYRYVERCCQDGT